MFRPVMTSVLASALALACGDQQSPTAPASLSTPSFSATAERSTANFAFGFGNDRRSVLVGATAEQWAAFCATGEQSFDSWNVLTLTRPDGSQKVTQQGKNLHLLVWDIPGSPPFPGDLCSESPAYTGIGRIVITDSDVDLSHQGTDAAGHTLTGTVTDASGQRYRLVAVIRLTVAEDTLDNFVIDIHVAKIQLTPIGH
jgi:hypothetical protein